MSLSQHLYSFAIAVAAIFTALSLLNLLSEYLNLKEICKVLSCDLQTNYGLGFYFD